MFANYKYERNEPALLDALGFQKPQNRQMEKEFLQVLINSESSQVNLLTQVPFISPVLSNNTLPTLIIVMGGFMDAVRGFAYDLCDVFRKLVKENSSFHLFYREHDESADVRLLVNHYAKCGSRIVLLGHSWGGSSLIVHVVRKVAVPIDLIITIDPVGVFRSKRVSKYVRYWLNVYVDYKKASYKKYNNVARIGWAWGNCPLASRNIPSIILKHQKVVDMFMLYCVEDVRQVLNFD